MATVLRPSEIEFNGIKKDDPLAALDYSRT